MANLVGLTKAIENKIHEKVHAAKEKINPLSATHKKERLERKTEKAELRKAELESLKEERKNQAIQRGKNRAKREFGTYKEKRAVRSAPRRSSGGSHGGGGGLYSSKNVPEYREAYSFVPPQANFVAPDAWGNYRQSKPKATQAPTETTTVKQNGQTIIIKKKAEQNSQEQSQQQKQPTYDFPDVLGLDPAPQGRINRNGSNFVKKKKKEYDPFLDFLA